MNDDLILLCFWLAITTVDSRLEFTANAIQPPAFLQTYRYYFEVGESVTMTTNDEEAVFWDSTSREFYKRGQRSINGSCSPTVMYTKPVISVNTADGLHRRIVSCNRTLPSPPIIVYEGSNVEVKVYNGLPTSGVIIHFHGLRQTQNFWYDGAGTLTQCPIMPRATFTYRFVAESSGTYFYHGHYMDDRGDGLEGPLIILPRPSIPGLPLKTSSTEPRTKAEIEYAAFLQDWYPDMFREEYSNAKWGMQRYSSTLNGNTDCYTETRAADGARIGQLMWHSALVNGRGWYSDSDLRKKPLSLPLETFHINRGQTVLLRFINAGIMFPFTVSIENHTMDVIASDGSDIEPVTVDSFTIFSGERYDVLVKGLLRPSKYHYGIVIKTIEAQTESMQPMEDHFGLAILKYSDLDTNYVTSEPILQLQDQAILPTNQHSKSLNCPFNYQNCINFETMFHVQKMTDLHKISHIDFKELFLNIYSDNSVNGLRFEYPIAPPAMLLHKKSSLASCSDCQASLSEQCRCTTLIEVELGTTLQLVILNMEKTLKDPTMLDAFAHPIHIHGNPFFLLHIGYPEYESSGLIKRFNQDIHCQDDDCNDASWSNKDKASRKLNLLNPPAKDTIAVPVGGYVVIRIHADNPGWWMAHCHMMPHHLDGMAFAIKVGKDSDMPPMPRGFPICFTDQFA